MLENNHNVHYKGVSKKEEDMGSEKDWVQPRRVMKGRPRMTAVPQAYRAISPNWSRKTEAPGGRYLGKKGIQMILYFP